MRHSVLIVDDHDIVRFGLETMINDAPDLRLVGSASTLAQALRLIAELAPDLVVTDMSMGDSKGLETVEAVVRAQAPRPVLVVSMHDELLYGESVLALGAAGYLMKDEAHALVLPAVRAVLAGQRYVSPKLNSRLLNRVLQRTQARAGGGPADALNALSMREVQVLERLRSGRTTKEIAFELGLSTRTVDVHRASIKRKLGLRSGAELIAFASART